MLLSNLAKYVMIVSSNVFLLNINGVLLKFRKSDNVLPFFSVQGSISTILA